MIVADHSKARQAGDCNTGALMQSKDALWRYARLFPEVDTAVSQRRTVDGSLEGAPDGRLLGFGDAGLTYRAFYESSNAEVQR